MTLRTGIIGRVRRLEQAAPAADNTALRERLERAIARVEVSISPKERERRQSPEYIAEKARRRAEHDARMAAIRALGRKPTIAETLTSGRELLP